MQPAVDCELFCLAQYVVEKKGQRLKVEVLTVAHQNHKTAALRLHRQAAQGHFSAAQASWPMTTCRWRHEIYARVYQSFGACGAPCLQAQLDRFRPTRQDVHMATSKHVRVLFATFE